MQRKEVHNMSTNSFADFNKAINNVAHGSMNTMSFVDIQSKFYKSILIFQAFNKVMYLTVMDSQAVA